MVAHADRLASLSSSAGHFAILAIDHRDALRALLDPADPAAVPAEVLTQFKRDVLIGAGSAATGVLLEPEYSIPQLVDELGEGVGFLAALEAQGYVGDPYSRVTTLLDGWSAGQAAASGAAGAKLLLFYLPHAGEARERQDELVRSVVSDCEAAGLPLFLEPIPYPANPADLGDPAEFARQRPQLVIESAKRLGALGPTVLKLQFPHNAAFNSDRVAWRDACQELGETVTGPWALLSGGDPYDVFREQVAIAGEAGCSGFMVGRAVWGPLVEAGPADRSALAASLVRPRIEELSAVAAAHCAPLTSR